MRINDMAQSIRSHGDLSPTQLRALVDALKQAAEKATDPIVKGCRAALDDLVEDIDHEIWEEAEAVDRLLRAEARDDFLELQGAEA